MGPVEITVIVLVAAFVATMAIVMIVRKAKGKPSLGSDCGCCPYSANCHGDCCHKAQSAEKQDDNVDDMDTSDKEARSHDERRAN